jgi:hypothetical protein
MNRQVGCGLHSVGVERHVVRPADRRDLSNGVHRPDLVVGIHHGDQRRVAADGLFDGLRTHGPILLHVQPLDVEAIVLLKLFRRLAHGVVLGPAREDPACAGLLAHRECRAA